MDNFDLRKYLAENRLLEDDNILRDVLLFIQKTVGLDDWSLDGIQQGEVMEYEANDVPPKILNYLKNVERFDFPIGGDEGYVLSYIPKTDQVHFENVL